MSAQPSAYAPLTAFAQHSITSPAAPQPGHKLDVEFEAIRVALSETQARLDEIQRDDGVLENESVHIEALSLRVRQLLMDRATPVGFWEGEHHYHANDYVEHLGGGFIALDHHTSGTDFAIDRAHGHWLIVTGEGTSATTGNFCPSAWAEYFVRQNTAAEARTALGLEEIAGEGLIWQHSSDELAVSVSELEPAAIPYTTDLQIMVEGVDHKLKRMSLSQLNTVLNSTSASATANRRPNGIYREFNH